MGSVEEKPGFMSSNWVTIVLIAVLLKTGGFERFKKEPDKKPELKPGVMQPYRSDGQPELAWVGDKLKLIV